MNRRALTLVLALILALTGCAATPTVSDNQRSGETTETVEPLVAETTEAPEAPAVADTPEARYLAGVRDSLHEDTQIPEATDEQLLAAAQDACQQIASGLESFEVRVIDGETPGDAGFYSDSEIIAIFAAENIC